MISVDHSSGLTFLVDIIGKNNSSLNIVNTQDVSNGLNNYIPIIPPAKWIEIFKMGNVYRL